MYAAGTPSLQKQNCLAFLKKVSEGDVRAVSSAEVLQEILHRYRAIHRFQEGVIVYDTFRSLPIQWLEVLPDDVDDAKEFLTAHAHVSSRDALHLAVMRRHKIKKILTYDQGFLGLPSVTVFLPESFLREE